MTRRSVLGWVVRWLTLATGFSLNQWSTMAYAFDDEFNGPVGAAPNPAKWNYDLGRWTDSNELETYTDSRANSYLDGQGHLVIKALRSGNGSGHAGYTSARLTTQGTFSRSHGNFEARIKFDLTTGPARVVDDRCHSASVSGRWKVNTRRLRASGSYPLVKRVSAPVDS